jgi:hypothetical protein
VLMAWGQGLRFGHGHAHGLVAAEHDAGRVSTRIRSRPTSRTSFSATSSWVRVSATWATVRPTSGAGTLSGRSNRRECPRSCSRHSNALWQRRSVPGHRSPASQPARHPPCVSDVRLLRHAHFRGQRLKHSLLTPQRCLKVGNLFRLGTELRLLLLYGIA